MTNTAQVVVSVFLFFAHSVSAATLYYDLSAHPTAVALQFDVDPGSSGLEFATVGLIDAPPHIIDSEVLGNGVTRYIVYSTSGDAISMAGKVQVAIESFGSFADGVIEIKNIVASDASGAVVPAQPNALPARHPLAPTYQSAEVGKTAHLGAEVFDLDGQLTSLTIYMDAVSIGSSSVEPYTVPHNPATVGTYAMTAVAVDDRGATNSFDLGLLRAFNLAEITGFGAFTHIHYGSEAEPDFQRNPYGDGLKDGVAYFLGMNPHQPDNSLLPKLAMSGGELVFRFKRLSSASGVEWDVLNTENLLAPWDVLALGTIHETDAGDGYHNVEVRIPFAALDANQQFLTLRVEQVEE